MACNRCDIVSTAACTRAMRRNSMESALVAAAGPQAPLSEDSVLKIAREMPRVSRRLWG